MVREGLDDFDRHTVYQLQVDARHTSSSDIAEAMDVSASTVRNRIARLEDEGIIRGYHADVDYAKVGFQLYTLIVCTAPIPDREELARAALEVSGVVDVQEVMTGEANVLVTAVGEDGDDLSRIGRELAETGLQVADEDIIRNHYVHPYHRFRTTAPGTDE
jgi:DNA-binding Lrp family transcriptional regulator